MSFEPRIYTASSEAALNHAIREMRAQLGLSDQVQIPETETYFYAKSLGTRQQMILDEAIKECRANLGFSEEDNSKERPKI